MRKFAKSIPEGTKDLIFEDCELKRSIENNICSFLKMRGYREIITPSIEFLDVFINAGNSLSDEYMYKLFDSKNRTLVLRPDNTMPIARLTATRLKDLEIPLRLYYNQNIFRINDNHNGKRDEVTQCGVELIGNKGLKADVEIISTAISALKKSCDSGFKIEIGHVGFFNALCQQAELKVEDYDRIREFTEKKNFDAIDKLLESYGENAQPLKTLPRLFGGNEVLLEAQAIAVSNTAKETLKYLKMLYSELCTLGFKDYILIDLGLVHYIDYYTDIIFRGYVSGSGQTALTGGRYDGLLSKFGTELPSTGFAINIDVVADAICVNQENKGIDFIIYYEQGFTKQAYEYADKLNLDGFTAVMSFEDSLENAIDKAKKSKAKNVIFVSETVEHIIL